jgi:hypothetical protein
LVSQQNAHAKAGATDPIPGTSKSGVKSGGAKSTTPAPTPAPTPAAPVVSSGTLTFAASSGGSCSGDFSILPYYPTLLDLVVNVNVSSLNVPDGTVLYVNAVGAAGGVVYPYITAPMVVSGGACSSSQHYFIYTGTALAGVTITDANGNVVFAGN